MAVAETMLDLLETIRAEDMPNTNVDSLYTRDDPTYRTPLARINRSSPVYRETLMETMRLIDRVKRGITPVYRLQEAMSTSDFAMIFGDIIDRQTIGFYTEVTPVWRSFMATGTVANFRTSKLYDMSGGESALEEVKELEEYPARAITPGEYAFSIKKYGARMPFSWEVFINDDLGLVTDTPRRFARAARRTESRFATGLYIGPNGPLAGLYSAGNKNIINAANSGLPYTANNPPLSIEALQQAFQVLSNMVDSDGEPIVIEAAVLVVPPSLRVVADNILNATTIDLTAQGASTGQLLRVDNWMRNALTRVVDPYIPALATSANGTTSWFLFASAASDRPALKVNFLRGYEKPQIFMKSPNATQVGSGGLIDPMQGDFDHDAIDYKIRHVIGGGILDPKMTVGSNGSGT